ncbi:MAG: hypothetical protein LBO62_05050, partial [Endomicrobium sp.]|nr:hypothetical protein [Endomicrobium sp.]
MIKKSAAILISLSLLCSAAFSDIAVQNAAQNGAFQANALPLIPNDLGKVINVSRFDGGAFSVINIQDLHCHAEVQKNIASIIEILQKNGNIAAVFTEGGYGKIDLSVYGAIKDADLKETFIENLLSQGRLTGSEYFALKRNLETPLYGLDEQETHLLNLERLAEITLKEERYLQVLSKVKSEIEYLQNKYLSKENKKLNKLVEKHRQGEISSRKYYALLCKYIEKVNAAGERYNPLLTVSLSKYPAFENYITLLKLSDQINYDKASREIQALLGNLKNVLTYAQYQKLSSDTNGFNDIYALSALLEEVFAQQGMAIKSANLEKLIDYSKKSAKFNPVKLIDEESAVIEDLRLAFSNGGDEVEISFLSDFEPSLEGFFKTTITAQELKFFEKNYDKFLQIYNKHAYKNELAVLDDDLAFLRQYHKTNEDRNNIFVKNIENVMRSFPGKTAIAVSGGFHSDALAELFKDKRISCITVMPKITKETKTAREKYSEILLSIHPTAVQSKELSNQAFAPQEFSTQSLALSLISQTDSHSFARVLLDSVFSNLKDMDFTEENFNKIADAIEALAGVSPTINYDGNYAKILFNENEFLFYKDGKGKIDEDSNRVIKKFNKVYKNESKKLETERLEEIFANSLSLANYMQTAVFTPNVSQIVKKGAQIAAQNGLTSGDMIFDIEMDETLPQIIDGVDRDLIRKMPDAAQRVILKSYERDSFFSDAQRTIYAKAVYAAYSALNADKAVLDSFLENRRTGFTQKTSSEAPDEVIAKELGVSEIKHYDIKDNFDDIALDALSGKAIALTFKRDASETDDKTYYNRVVNNMELLSKALLENKFDISKFIGQYNSPQTALYEMLKNAFVHGNHLDGNLSVYIRIDEEKGEVKVLNKKHDTPYSDFAESPQFYDTLPDLHGYSMAQLVSSQNFYLIYTHSDPSDEFYIEQFTLNEDYIIRRRPTADDKPYNSLTLESSYDIADKIIDKLPVKNESFQYFVWNAVISIVEFLPSALLPHKMFVAAHYPEFVERLSNKTMAGFLREYREIKKEMAKNPGKYGLRLQGAKRIKIATTLGAFAGISAAIITSAALPIAIIAAIALSFIFNIATHADYNQRIDDNGLGFSSHRLTVGEEEYHGSIINIDELIGGDGQNIYLAEYSDGTISEVSAGEYNAYWRLAERMARQTLTPKRRETAQAAQSLTSVQKGLAYKEASAKIYAIVRA